MPRLAPWALALGAFWTLGALVLPPVQDEAYYALWARHLALGYFDHPPLVAWIASTGLLAPGHALAARLGTLVVASATVLASLRFFRAVGLTETRSLWTALVLANFNLMGLALGIVTTPDTGLMLAWVLALGEAATALKGRESRWLTAGAATGLGLLSKYTCLLMGPIFLWALIVATKTGPTRGLKSPWPYAGGLVALLVFMPNLYWNAQNDWITFRFQARHGFSLERPEALSGALPRAEKPALTGPEYALARPFLDLERREIAEERRPRAYDSLLAALNRYVGFYASQVGLWGAILAVFGIAWRARRAADRLADPSATVPLVKAAAMVPLIVFGLLSLGSKVEANWSAMYVFGFAAWLAPTLARSPRALGLAAAANLGIGLVLLAHAEWRILPVRPHKDRLLKETHGYQELGAFLEGIEGLKFADTYQLVSMARFYVPDLKLAQWPGITRDSELVSASHLPTSLAADVAAGEGFSLIGTELPPPHLPGFEPQAMTQLRDCLGTKLEAISADQAEAGGEERCRTPIHVWYLTAYGKAHP